MFVVALLALAVGCPLYLVGFKLGWIPVHPWLFAALVTVLGVGLLLELGLTVIRLVRRRSAIPPAAAKALLLAGGALICGGGTVNWLRGLEGYMVLSEGDALPLFGSRHLQDFTAGPLADPQDMHLILRLLRVKLHPGPGGAPQAVATLRVEQPGQPARRVVVASGDSASVGVLRIHGGAFGFSPRIVITQGSVTLFDQVVPFTTRLKARGELRFSGAFTLKRHQLAVSGTVSLQELNRELRGHPYLQLQVRRGGEVLGAGELRPGHFATLKGGYRPGFSGLKKWVELDISRRTYTGIVLIGAALALLSGALWPLLAWLSKRRRGAP